MAVETDGGLAHTDVIGVGGEPGRAVQDGVDDEQHGQEKPGYEEDDER